MAVRDAVAHSWAAEIFMSAVYEAGLGVCSCSQVEGALSAMSKMKRERSDVVVEDRRAKAKAETYERPVLKLSELEEAAKAFAVKSGMGKC